MKKFGANLAGEAAGQLAAEAGLGDEVSGFIGDKVGSAVENRMDADEQQ